MTKRKTMSLRDQVRFWLVDLSIDQEWTQLALADELDISTKHMNLIWHGKYGMSWELADRWAAVLGVQLVVTIKQG